MTERKGTNRFSLLLPLLVTGLFTLLFCVAAVRDELAGARSLAALKPVISEGIELGKFIARSIRPALLVSICVTLGFLFVPILFGGRGRASDRRHRLFLLVCAAAVSFQGLLLFRLNAWAYALLLPFAILLVLLARKDALPAVSPVEADSAVRSPLLWFSALILLALVFRTYALNQLPAFFEGELSPYYLGATNLPGMFHAAAGTNGPWAPLGLLYYLPMYLCFEVFGVSLHSVRLSSVLTSVGTIALLFVFVRGIAGTWAALAAAAFMTFDNLQIGWGRTDIHPHGSNTWPTLLLCMAVLNLLRQPSWPRALLMTLAMALTWHQYPSGQAAVAIPWLLLIWVFFWSKEQRPTRHYWTALALGSLLWCLGGFLVDRIGLGHWYLRSYRHSLGERVYVNRLEEQGEIWEQIPRALEQVLQFGSDLIAGVFYEAPYLFHQDILQPIQELPIRTVLWLVAALALVALPCLVLQPKRKEHAVLLAWIIAAAVPALFSDRAYPKRASSLYPALMVCAGIAFGWTLNAARSLVPRFARFSIPALVALAVTAQSCLMIYLWFSPERNRYGRSYVENLRATFESLAAPRTRFIAYVEDNYEMGKLSFSFLTALQEPERQPLLWLVNRYPLPQWNELLACPARMEVELKGRPFYYLWPALQSELEQGFGTTNWERTVYLVHLEREGKDRFRELTEIYPQARTLRNPPLPQRCPGCDYAWIIVDAAEISRPECR